MIFSYSAALPRLRLSLIGYVSASRYLVARSPYVLREHLVVIAISVAFERERLRTLDKTAPYLRFNREVVEPMLSQLALYKLNPICLMLCPLFSDGFEERILRGHHSLAMFSQVAARFSPTSLAESFVGMQRVDRIPAL